MVNILITIYNKYFNYYITVNILITIKINILITIMVNILITILR